MEHVVVQVVADREVRDDLDAVVLQVLGVPDADGEVVLIRPDLDVPDGGAMY